MGAGETIYTHHEVAQLLRWNDEHIAKIEKEIAWWREVFSTRFMSDNLPRSGTALYGSRLRIQIETKDGWEDWHPKK